MDDLVRKALTGIEWKGSADEGAFRAVIATHDVVDHDGDVTLAGAIPPGSRVVISPFNHSSAKGSSLPVGYGITTSDAQKSYVDGKFLLNTPEGKSAYETTKALHEQGIGEWSYAFRVGNASTERKELARFPGAKRILKAVLPKEASLVFAGAGIATETLAIKSGETEEKAGARYSSRTRGFLKDRITAIRAALDELEADVDGAPSVAEETEKSDDDLVRIYSDVRRMRQESLASAEELLGRGTRHAN